MRSLCRSLVPALAILSLGCRGELVEPRIPGPHTTGGVTPALAFRLGGTGSDQIAAIARDPSGTVYVTGTFTGTVDFDPGTAVTTLTSLGTSDIFLAAYSASGALVWADRIGGTGSESVSSLARDGSGNLVLGGTFDGTPDFDPGPATQTLISKGSGDGFVAKYSAAGGFLWARRFGGTAGDDVRALAVDAAGNIYAVGGFSGQADALPAIGASIVSDGSEADGFVLSLDGAGTVRWAFPVGGPGADAATAVAVTVGGTVAVAGGFTGTADFSPGAAVTSLTSLGGQDVFLAGYTGTGNLLWARAIGGTGEETPAPGAIGVDATGGIAVAGTFGGTTDFDPAATVVARTSLGTTDLFIARYSGAGVYQSVFTLGGVGASIAPGGLTFDAGGDLLVTGAFAGTLDFDPGVTNSILTSLAATPATDVFAARYTPAGGLLWIARFGDGSAAGGANASTAVAEEGTGGAVVAGRFYASPDFDPGTGAFRLTSFGEADGFVVRLNASGGLATIP